MFPPFLKKSLNYVILWIYQALALSYQSPWIKCLIAKKEALNSLTRNSFQLQNCVHAIFTKLARPPAAAATFILIEKALYLHVVEHELRTHDV